jgi:hypothetical protein
LATGATAVKLLVPAALAIAELSGLVVAELSGLVV